ncbi:MAG: pyrroline-5-carboxylate reductase [Treponema sp.]|jgi:pyrroline-5-carboxylate reductase|nr:pyrroline-5-carboxylate reductase [Treponema sp.]
MKKLSDVIVGFIGAGNMGFTLAKVAAKVIPGTRILLTNRSLEKTAKAAVEIGATALASNTELTQKSDVIFLGVKPYQIEAVLGEIAGNLGGKIVVSMAAGVSFESIRSHIGQAAHPAALVRISPNTPACVGEGMTALAVDNDSAESLEAAELVTALLASGGRVEAVPETLLTCVGAVSGCGPAYGFVFIEALADAAVALGMPRRQAYIYAAQTLKGAATLTLESGDHPGVLKDAVCSPGGTTIEALRVLEERGFRAAIINAVHAAARKTAELGKK